MQNITALADDFLKRLNSSTSLDNIKQELEKKYKDKDKINLENQIISIELTLFSFQILNPNLLKDFDNFTNLAINQAHDELINIYKWKSEPSINDLCITLSQINEVINESIKPIISIIRKDKITLETYESLKHLHSLKVATYSAKNLFLNAYTSEITPSFLNEFKTKLDDLGQNLTSNIDIKEIIASPEELFEVDNIEMLKTNFNYLNKSLGGGFATQNLYTLCGASGKGKTTLAIQLISDFAKQGIKSAFISLEMGRKELLSRFTANLSSVPYYKIKNHRMKMYSLTDEEKAKIINANDDLKNIAIVGKKALKELSLLEQVIKYLAQNNYKFCVIDTKDQIKITNYKGESYEKHNDIANSLKELSMEQSVSILLLSQTNRSLDNLKKGELPNKSHISLSDGTYTQSDGISFIYTEPESKVLALYTDKSRYAPKSDEVQAIEIDNECLRVREINTLTHLVEHIG